MDKTSAAVFCLEVVLITKPCAPPLKQNSVILTPLLLYCTITI